MAMNNFFPFGVLGNILFAIVLLWSAVWKGIGLWKSGRNNQFYWFIAMFVLNTAGILPIIYLVWFQPHKRIKKKKK